MKKNIKTFIALVTLVFLSNVICFVNAQETEQQLTQGEFAVRLVKALGIDSGLTDSDPAENYIERLKTNGIQPEGGFQKDKIITKEVKSKLLMQAFKFEAPAASDEPRSEFYRDKATIIQIEGEVQIKSSGKEEWIKAEKGMKLSEKDYIRTGSKSLADLTVGTAGRVRIKENTELLLKTLSTQADLKREAICLYLAMGEMTVDANKIPEDSIFLTATPTATVGVRGTIYNVKVTESKTEVN